MEGREERAGERIADCPFASLTIQSPLYHSQMMFLRGMVAACPGAFSPKSQPPLPILAKILLASLAQNLQHAQLQGTLHIWQCANHDTHQGPKTRLALFPGQF